MPERRLSRVRFRASRMLRTLALLAGCASGSGALRVRLCAMLGLALAAAGTAAPAHAADNTDLPNEIARVITALKVPPGNVSILVQAVGADTPVLSHEADVPRNPASVMKTVTTWAALETLGPAYTWRTEVYFDGPFDGSRLNGDLVLKGYGDPFLVEEHYWKLLRSARSTTSRTAPTTSCRTRCS